MVDGVDSMVTMRARCVDGPVSPPNLVWIRACDNRGDGRPATADAGIEKACDRTGTPHHLGEVGCSEIDELTLIISTDPLQDEHCGDLDDYFDLPMAI